ncbi:MAG: hypothetical protein M3Q65_22670, partial [Chloroflexota bacterium]|nr:hypothetical protein [Chloroflexota bacterium]
RPTGRRCAAFTAIRPSPPRGRMSAWRFGVLLEEKYTTVSAMHQTDPGARCRQRSVARQAREAALPRAPTDDAAVVDWLHSSATLTVAVATGGPPVDRRKTRGKRRACLLILGGAARPAGTRAIGQWVGPAADGKAARGSNTRRLGVAHRGAAPAGRAMA